MIDIFIHRYFSLGENYRNNNKPILFFISCTIFSDVSKTLDFIDQSFIKNEDANAINKNAKKDIEKEEWNVS